MKFAARLLASGVDPGFTAPGPAFTAMLPEDVLGRRVVACPVENVETAGRWWRDAPVHAKLAEAKREAVPAVVYPNLDAFLGILDDAGVPAGSWVQLSDPVVFEVEARCFMLYGIPVTASVYLDHGETWDSFSAPRDASWAVDAARRVGAAVTHQPRAYTLDVGRFRDGRVVVVEANPAWSSAPYHCGLGRVAEVVMAGQGDPLSVWRWRPDPSILTLRYPLQRRSVAG